MEMRRLKDRFSTAFLWIAIIITVFLTGCRAGGSQASTSKGAPGSNLPVKQVRLATSESRQLTNFVTAPGTLAADEQATLSFKVAGRLDAMRVDLGSIVRKGQVIAQLETIDFKGRVNQAMAGMQQARVRLGLPPEGEDDQIQPENTALVREARAVLQEARANRERTVQLVNQGILSRAELDRVESTYKVADSRFQDALEEVRNRQAVLLQRRSELSLARQQLAETTLYAPFDGAIRERRANLGEYLASGAPVATIVRVHPLRLRVEVPEREAQGIQVGQTVRVVVEDNSSASYSGRVARLSPAFQEQSRTLIIEAEVDNSHGRLRAGSFAKAEILASSTTRAVMVPAAAVVTFAGIQKVFTEKNGKANEIAVVLGKKEGDWVAVDGIEAGQNVILSPGNIVAGQPVTVIQ
jgi:HlyD family secretion protein